MNAAEPKEVNAYPKKLYLCGECGSTFIIGQFARMNYCPNCGTKVLWKENEDVQRADS